MAAKIKQIAEDLVEAEFQQAECDLDEQVRPGLQAMQAGVTGA